MGSVARGSLQPSTLDRKLKTELNSRSLPEDFAAVKNFEEHTIPPVPKFLIMQLLSNIPKYTESGPSLIPLRGRLASFQDLAWWDKKQIHFRKPRVSNHNQIPGRIRRTTKSLFRETKGIVPVK